MSRLPPAVLLGIGAVAACGGQPQATRTDACAGIEIHQAWVREPPPGAEMLAGYLLIRNRAAEARSIAGVSSPQFGGAEMHESLQVDGVMQMRALAPLALPSGAEVVLEPGGKHLMLMQPQKALRSGDTVNLRFHCGDGAVLDATAIVRAR